MFVRRFIIAAALVGASPLAAQTSDQQAAARNASNWDIFHKLYPARAIAAREEGAVGFTVALDSKGEVTNCQVTHSSGHPLLDEETCKLITMHAQFKPDPTLSPSQRRTSQGVIAWKLPASTTVLASPKAVSASAAPEKIVCKKFIRTGTLGGVERTCMTPTQWAKQSEEQKAEWMDLQGKKGHTKGN